MPTILGIESSCDDTSVALCVNGKVINNEVSQQAIHESYGGVVPELASRAHHKNIVPLVDHVLKEAAVPMTAIDGVAYTRGPGLLGALLVGSSFAKAMAAALCKPIIPVNHMRAHVLAHFIDPPYPTFPFLCLTVSGGHTQIVLMEDFHKMHVIGKTIDDAAGEAFDKSAKLLGLQYPGGPLIDQYAEKGDPNAFPFKKSKVKGLDFSFSGVKTSVLYFLQKQLQENPQFIEQNLADLCASLQHTIIQMLMEKLKKAAIANNIKSIGIAGGVSANKGLRQAVLNSSQMSNWNIFIPEFQYCTDNAGMIAKTGSILYDDGIFGKLTDSPLPRMPFEEG